MKKLFALMVIFGVILSLPANGQDMDNRTTTSKEKLTFAEARHLLSRTGYGGTPKEISALTKYTRVKAVDHILSKLRTTPYISPPEWVDEGPPNYRELRQKMRSLGEKERRELRRQLRRKMRGRAQDLKAWWFREMCQTDSPLTEKMVMFWHNHFTSSLRKARWPQYMYRQNTKFRKYAVGNFGQLVKVMAKDPAMVIYLDSRSNRKGKPNENFARELMELFTLGEGNYTEFDIKQAARAFTGYTVHRGTGNFQFRPRLHDWGKKKFMGKEGYFGGDDVINIILKRSQCAQYIVTKMWREFISPNPNEQEVKRLAAIFRNNNYEIKPLVRALFLSDHFWDPKNHGALIKSPVELIVGTIRLFGSPTQNMRFLTRISQRLGQNVMDPPNVKGWEGGNRWISSSTLLQRRQLLYQCMRCTDPGVQKNMARMKRRMKGRRNRMMRGKRGRMMRAMQKQRETMKQRLALDPWLDDTQKKKVLKKTLLAVDPVMSLPKTKDRDKLVRAMVFDLSYQLK